VADEPKTKPRRIMHKFRIDEISGVDSPAQKGARPVIVKRDDSADDLDKKDKSKDEDGDEPDREDMFDSQIEDAKDGEGDGKDSGSAEDDTDNKGKVKNPDKKRASNGLAAVKSEDGDEIDLAKETHSHGNRDQHKFASPKNEVRHKELTRQHDQTNAKIFSLVARGGPNGDQPVKNKDNRTRELMAQRQSLKEQIHQNLHNDTKLGGIHPGLYGKSDEDGEALDKRLTLLTNVGGHTHLLDDGKDGGMTSCALMPGEDEEHCHPWVKNDSGQIVVGEDDGHAHEVLGTMKRDFAKETHSHGNRDKGGVGHKQNLHDAEARNSKTVEQLVAHNEKYDEHKKARDENMNAMRYHARRAVGYEKSDVEEYWKKDFTEDERKKLADSGAAMPDGSFPINNKEDLSNALHAQGRSKHSSETVRAHIRRRAKALGLEGQLPESFGNVGKNQGESMDPIQELKSQISDLEKKLDEERAYGALTDAEKQMYSTLDKADRKEFLKNPDRKAALEKADKSNPVVYTAADGTTFRKNDDPRMTAMAKRNDALEKSNREQAVALTEATFAKRASDELKSLPGTAEAKVALLKAVDGIGDANLKKAVGEMVKASSSNLAKAFQTMGSASGGQLTGSHEDQLETLAKRHADTNKVSLVKARVDVLETPEGKAIYQQMIESKG